MLTTIWLGLLAICTDTPYSDIHQELPTVLCTAVNDQIHLGWDHLYQGHWSQCWAIAIDSLHPTLAVPGTKIIMVLIQTIWRNILKTWQTCNQQHLHNDNGQLSSLPNY